MKNTTKYSISIGKYNGQNKEPKNNNIPEKEVEILEHFDFFDHSVNSSFLYLKEYFLENFGHKYQWCLCEFSVFSKSKNVYQINISSEETKLKNSVLPDKILYLIQLKTQCNCEFKPYKEYLTCEKSKVIKKLRNLDEKIKQLEEEINKKDLSITDLNNKISESEKEKEKLKEENEQIVNNLKNEIEKLKTENENSKNKNEELNKEIAKLRKTDELKYHLNPTFEDFYDIIIDINSIKKVNREGWKVKFNEKGLEKYNKYKEKELITIGVLGNNNKGKSFLLSKISKIKLLSGTSIHTEGLSVKYPELKGYKGRQIILLDSAGFETPVLKKENNKKIEVEEKADDKDNKENTKTEENETGKDNSKELVDDEDLEKNKEFKENARDKIMTELFLENLIIKVSDILLVVVGKLTYSEQLLINKIKVEAKRQNKGRIFVIHNLQEFRTVEQVIKYISESLLKCSTFELNKRKWVTTRKDEEVKEGDKKIEKENEAKEESEKIDNNQNQKDEQNKENEIIIDIKDKIIEKDEKSEYFNIHFTEIINYEDKKLEIYHLILANEDSEAGKFYNQYTYNFIESVYNLIPEPKTFNVFDQVKENFKRLSDTILNDNIEEAKFNDNKNILEEKNIKLNYENDLSLKRCYTDELSFSFFKASKFEPKYNYFKPKENILEIRLEIPGNVKIDVNHKVVGDETIITVKGIKNKDKQPEKLNLNLFNIREFSEFELNIPLKVEYFKINSTKPMEGFPKFVNGVCIIRYELASKGEGGTASTEEL